MFLMLSKKAISRVLASVIIVIIALAALGGYYYYSTQVTAPAPQQTVTVLMWGGDFAASFNNTVAKDFEAIHPNVQVVIEQGQASSDMLAKVEAMKANPTIDMVWLSDTGANQAVLTGLCDTVDTTTMPNLANMYPNFILNNSAVGIGEYSDGLIYNTKYISASAANSWWILWNDTYKGKIALPDLASYGPYFLLTAARLGGGSEYNIDPGFQLIKKLRPNVLEFFTSDSDKFNIFERGDAWIELGLLGDSTIIQTAGYPNAGWSSPKEGVLGFIDYACIVKGAPHEDLARQLMNFYLQPKYAHEFGTPRGYAPVLKNITLTANETAEGILTSQQLATVYIPNQVYISQHLDAWIERWNTEIAPAPAPSFTISTGLTALPSLTLTILGDTVTNNVLGGPSGRHLWT